MFQGWGLVMVNLINRIVNHRLPALKIVAIVFLGLSGCAGRSGPTGDAAALQIYRDTTDMLRSKCEATWKTDESSNFHNCEEFAWQMGLCSTEAQNLMDRLTSYGTINACPRVLSTVRYKIAIWKSYEAGDISITDARLKTAEAESNLMNTGGR